MLHVTPLYAALLGLLFLILSIRVILSRRTRQIGFGAPQDSDLERRVRVHANFAEYTPFALLLLAFAELNGAPPVWLHIGGGLLLFGRLSHAMGVSRPSTDETGRILGMTGSQSAILIGVTLIVWTSVH